MDDLLDATQVADRMGLASAGAVRVYVARFDDFPEPCFVRHGGRFVCWHRRDIEAFLKRHPGLGRKLPRQDESNDTS
jgi:predicted DNA-binding transcriptional regulator AlpA